MYSELSTTMTAEAFHSFITSKAGGSLIFRDDRMTPESPLAMIYYDKEKSDMASPNTKAFRSVVWNMNTNRPVCVGPRHGSTFVDTIDMSNVGRVEDFVDGVMINMFHDGATWRLATRTQLDATGHFYGKRPFAELFWETFRNKGLDVATLDPTVTYSWVLQHPEERVVVNPSYGIAGLWLVEVGAIDMDGTFMSLPIPSVLQAFAPARHDVSTAAEIRDRVTAWGHRFGSQWKGLMIHMTDGTRYKLRSAEYDAAAALRGNQAKLPYLWLERWTEGKLGTYVRAFPEESHAANATVQQFKALTQEFYDLYQRVYRKRDLRLGEAPHKFRKLLWEARAIIKSNYFGDFRDFMNRQDTARKLWLINYEERYAGFAPPPGPLFAAP
jgi:hypothetical protein